MIFFKNLEYLVKRKKINIKFVKDKFIYQLKLVVGKGVLNDDVVFIFFEFGIDF